jgi:tetratricopeptide (TPR) repeat protein
MPNIKCQRLLREGLAFFHTNDYDAALPKFTEAREADPEAPDPLGFLGSFWLRISQITTPEYVDGYREQAENYARASLALDDSHPIALSVLSGLLPTPPAYQPTEAARGLASQAELLFIQKQYQDAHRLYLASFREDPNYTDALKYAGNCHFSSGDYENAERLFLQTTELAPLDAQAWRFLASVYARQQKFKEQLHALYFSIGANPNYFPVWGALSEIFRIRQKPLVSCHVKPHAFVSWEPSEKRPSISVSQQAGNAVRAAAWVCYAVSKAKHLSADGYNGSLFEIEREALSTAGRFVQEKLDANPSEAETLGEPLLTLAKLVQKDLMTQATFMLCFREEFRPEFEAWKKENPGLYVFFIEAERLRPY